MNNLGTADGHDMHHDDSHHGPSKGISRWLYTTNHKDIGSLYLWFSLAMFLLGGTFALVIRLELFQPGLQFVEPNFFNQMTTMHGLVMVFWGGHASLCGLGKLDDSNDDWRARYGIAAYE